MHHPPPAQFLKELQCLLTQLQDEKYPHLEFLDKEMHAKALAVQINDTHDAAQHYSSLCIKLHQLVTEYLRMHRLVIVPYISDLLKREDAGHDCGACSDGCSIRHSSHISDIREAHVQMSEVQSWLQDASNDVTTFPEGWEELKDNILLLDTALTELFLVEESKLIPMMIALQNNIGALA